VTFLAEISMVIRLRARPRLRVQIGEAAFKQAPENPEIAVDLAYLLGESARLGAGPSVTYDNALSIRCDALELRTASLVGAKSC
jgi:hypothetical protein